MDLKTRLESHPVATLKKDRFNHIRHAKEPAPKKIIKIKKKEPTPPPPAKKIIKVKRTVKGGKVIKGSTEEMHPEGIHLHINWKDGETELKKFKNEKEGVKAFKKIREERKEKRDYKTMKLMDGLKALEYSA